MAKPPIDPGSADVGAAVLSGDAFYRLAQEFVNYAAPNFQSAQSRAAKHLGELIASATNLALSIEIYLKALLLHNGRAAPKTHELPELFSKLPASIQSEVEMAYETLRKSEAAGVTASFAVHVTTRRTKSPNFGKSPKLQENSLRAVLQRSANAFITWRYLFAHPTTEISGPLIYEFLRQSFAAQALRKQFGQLEISVTSSDAPGRSTA